MSNYTSNYINDGEFPEAIQRRLDAGQKCGSSIGKGWLPIVEQLDKDLAELHPNYVINQIKEKFGALRFYTSGAMSSKARQLIHAAEAATTNLCEICGAPGKKISPSGWIMVRCDDHIPATDPYDDTGC